MSLQQLLDETIPTPPPFASVDDLIAGERRAAWRRRARVGGVAATALAVVVGVAIWGTPWPGGSGPVGGPSPTFELPRDPELQRLDDAVRAAMRREAPDLRWLDNDRPLDPHNPDPTWYSTWVDSEGDDADGPVYLASAVFRSQGRSGTLTVNVSRLAADQPLPACFPPGVAGITCVLTTGDHGEKIRLTTIHYPVEPAQIEISAEVVRTDGTHVYVEVRNQGGASENAAATGEAPPMDLAQVQRVALDPTLVRPTP
jgi:hypothetical protein